MISNTPTFTLPPRIGSLLARLPPYPGSVLLAAALNLALADRLPPDVGRLLLGRKLRIQVRDARLVFDISWTGSRFEAMAAQQPADVILGASAQDFLRLAQRQEDPDTLFFSRRLSMEGDTELGLVVKNALDALELPVLELRQWTPRKLLSRVAVHPRRPGIGPRRAGGAGHE